MRRNHKLDRLVPRYHLDEYIIDWDVQVQSSSRLWRKNQSIKATKAILVDISIEGAFIATLCVKNYSIGDAVAVRVNGVDGKAIVRHRSKNDDIYSYGIQWAGPQKLLDVVETLVAQARGDEDGEMQKLWESGRR